MRALVWVVLLAGCRTLPGRPCTNTIVHDEVEGEFGYDAAGRLVTYRENGATVLAREYDEAGRRVHQIEDFWGEHREAWWTYDAQGRVARVETTFAGSSTRSYDQRGRLERVVDEAGRVTRYVYRGDTIEEWSGDRLLWRYRFDHGRIAELSDASGPITDYVYEHGHLIAEGDARYAWDGDRLVGESYGDQTVTYDYDLFGRLHHRHWSDGKEHWVTELTWTGTQLDRVERRDAITGEIFESWQWHRRCLADRPDSIPFAGVSSWDDELPRDDALRLEDLFGFPEVM